MKKIFLTCLLGFILPSIYAQSVDFNGTWTLDSVSFKMINQNDSIKLDGSAMKQNIDYAVFDQLIFKDNTLRIYSNNMIEPIIGKPIISKNQLIFDFLARFVSYNYKFDSNKLFLEQRYAPDDTSPSYYKIILVYTKK